jgi:hypothetical protein
MTENWIALAREAGLAAEHLAIGATALGKADFARHAHYAQAFFALSTGLERSAKLILVVDHAIQNSGVFPPNRHIKAYGHDLAALLRRLDDIAVRLNLRTRLPNAPIHTAIISILSEFATNVTRYYNLEVLTSAPNALAKTDPIQRWHDEVIALVLRLHYKAHQRARDEGQARALNQVFGPFTMVMQTSENKRSINSLYDSSKQGLRVEFAKPYVRLYLLQIVRFVGELAGELGGIAQFQRIEDVPTLSEFFAIFCRPDRYLKSRKTWSIYTP